MANTWTAFFSSTSLRLPSVAFVVLLIFCWLFCLNLQPKQSSVCLFLCVNKWESFTIASRARYRRRWSLCDVFLFQRWSSIQPEAYNTNYFCCSLHCCFMATYSVQLRPYLSLSSIQPAKKGQQQIVKHSMVCAFQLYVLSSRFCLRPRRDKKSDQQPYKEHPKSSSTTNKLFSSYGYVIYAYFLYSVCSNIFWSNLFDIFPIERQSPRNKMISSFSNRGRWTKF